MTIASLREWLSRAPTGTMVPAATVLEVLNTDANESSARLQPSPTAAAVGPSWRERLWTCPIETRLSVSELAEAVGRPKSWAYRHTSQKSGYRVIPHTKLDGEIVFRAGDVRRWILEAEGALSPATVEKEPARVLSIGERTTRRKR